MPSTAQFSKLGSKDDDKVDNNHANGIELLEQGAFSSSASIDNEPDTGPKQYLFLDGTTAIIFRGPLNLLMLATPFALVSKSFGLSESWTFLFALLSIAPFAERLGFVTEQISIHTSEVIGGLLNATFGNATELILSIAALRKGYFRIIQLSLLGSVLSNILLVLGSALFYGGMKFKTQKFDKLNAQVNCSLLLLGAVTTTLPNAMTRFGQLDVSGTISISRYCSIILLVMYSLYLYFQLVTHVESDSSSEVEIENEGREVSVNIRSTTAVVESSSSDTEGDEEDEEDEESDKEDDILGLPNSILWLTVITIFISMLSDLVVETIEKAATSLKVPSIFIATIVVPIIGNAAEHTGAIMFAGKNRVNLTLGVALGSGTQIALMVLPLLVVVGWIEGKSLSLDIGSTEALVYLFAVLLATVVLKDGHSNWLVGAALMAAYGLVSICFWFHSPENIGAQNEI